jgi:hypothetical protein
LAVVLLACWFAIRNNLHDLSDALARLTLLDIVVMGVLGVVATVAGYRSWRTVLVGLHADMPHHDARSMFFCSQIGKYLPGSVWPALIQTEIGARHRVPRPSVLLAYLVALVASLSAAATMSLALLAAPRSGWLAVGAIGAGVGGVTLLGVLVVPGGAQRFLTWVSQRRKLSTTLTIDRGNGQRSYGYALVAWAALCSQGVWLAARLTPHHVAGTALVAVAGATAFSWSCGFLALPVPAGAGIREAIFTFALAESLGRPTAIAVAVVTRLTSVAVDLGAAFFSGLPSLVTSMRKARRLATADVS